MASTQPSSGDTFVFSKLLREISSLAERGNIWEMIKQKLIAVPVTHTPESYIDNYALPVPIANRVSEAALEDCRGGADWKNELENEIHPMFSRSRWVSDENCQMTDEIFALIKPALQLASLFLTMPKTRTWFRNVATRPIKVHASGSFSYFELSSEPVNSGDEKVENVLLKMTEIVMLSFLESDILDGEFVFKQGRIRLNKKFIADLQQSKAPNLSLIFWMAYSILHEIGHAFFFYARVYKNPQFQVAIKGNIVRGYRWEPFGPFSVTREPRYQSGQQFQWPEMGRSLELAAFRYAWSHVHRGLPINSELALALKVPPVVSLLENKHRPFKNTYKNYPGMLIEDWPEEHLSLPFVTGKWIQKWFLKETWADSNALDALNAESNFGQITYKDNYPVECWETFFVSLPQKKDVLVMCWIPGGPAEVCIHFYADRDSCGLTSAVN